MRRNKTAKLAERTFIPLVSTMVIVPLLDKRLIRIISKATLAIFKHEKATHWTQARAGNVAVQLDNFALIIAVGFTSALLPDGPLVLLAVRIAETPSQRIQPIDDCP